MSTAIDIRSVVKRYGTTTALHSVGFEIGDNEFFTLLGPSGCGKTTLLRCIAGFEDVSEGQILLFGQDIAGLEPNLRPVNTVFQQYALFPHLSVIDNVAFGLKMKGMALGPRRERAGKMLEMVHLSAFADRMPAQLSGGQQQRVALARALAPEPKVLLLDEPLSALDLKLRKEMQIELKRLQTETGITFIFVTHDQEEALSMSDRVVVMNGGIAEQVGAPFEVYNRPTTRFVATFVGTLNLFEAEAEGAGALAERQQLLQLFVPQVQVDGAEAFPDRQALGIFQVVILAQHFGQAIKGDARVKVVDVVDADIRRQPAQGRGQDVMG